MITMPDMAYVSIFMDNDLTHITEDHFEIKLIARLLDQIYVIQPPMFPPRYDDAPPQVQSPYSLLVTDHTLWSFVVYCCCFCLYFGCGGDSTNYVGECCESVPWNRTGSYILSQ